MSKIIHLDCTLRDGGYYNNWKFDQKLVNKYLYSLEQINIDYVEIGFRFFDKKKAGDFAYCKESFLKSLIIPKKIKLAVMVNASDFFDGNFYKNNILKKLFVKKTKSRISLVRVAVHFHELKNIKPLISQLKILGYEVGINLMQISNKKKFEIKKAVMIIKKLDPKVLYFADSLGSLNLEQTINIIKQIKKVWKKDIGIHTHNNLGNALKNSIIAYNNGVKWIDTTVNGMGRGPGNTKTELAIFEFEKIKKQQINIIPLIKLVNNEFKHLKDKYNWGTNPYYYMAGKWGIHPSFIQEMIAADFSEEKILENLKDLKKIRGHNFSKDLINTNELFYYGKILGEWKPKDVLSGKDILILASGPSIEKHKKKIVKFIKQKKLIVFKINNEKTIDERIINYRIACHTMRILIDSSNYHKSKTPIILPFKRFSDKIKKTIKNIKTLDFGLQVKKNAFEFYDSYVILPNSLAFSYALGIANSGQVNKIFLAGFDGYINNHPKKIEMDNTIENYRKIKKSIKLISITPTKYKINYKKI